MGTVYYATNRKPDNPAAPTAFGDGYNGKKPGALIFGVAQVNAPPGHADGRPKEAKSAAAITLTDPSPAGFSAAAKSAILAGPDQLILSVHGFNYRFWESVARADFLSRWFAEGPFGHSNTMVMFGWPSAGAFGQYPRDWQRATDSGPALKRMLDVVAPLIADFRSLKGAAARVAVLAHSMGNHALDSALAGPVPAVPGLIDRIILVAADEGRNELTAPGNLAVARQLAERVHVYYNNQDVALGASQLVFHHFVVRLGVDGPPNKDGFKGTNVSFVNTSVVGAGNAGDGYEAEGHQYYRLIPEVRDDLCAVMALMPDAAIPNRIYRDDPTYDWENYWLIETATTEEGFKKSTLRRPTVRLIDALMPLGFAAQAQVCRRGLDRRGNSTAAPVALALS